MKKEGGNILERLLAQGFQDNAVANEQRNFFLLAAFSALGFCSLVIFGLSNLLWYEQLALGALELFGGLLIAINFLSLHLHRHILFSKHFLLYIIMAELVILLLTGGIAATGIFWFFTFPAPVFYLEGRRGGIIWMALLTLITLIISLLGHEGYITLPYSLITIRQMLVSLFIVAALIYSFEVSRERAEKEEELIKNDLKKNQERALTLERLAHIGTWRWDVSEDRFSWSEELFRLHDMQPRKEVLTSREYFEHLATEDADRLRILFSRALGSGVPFTFEYTLKHPTNGTERILKGQGEVEFDDQGSATCLFGTLQDVTITKKIEHKTLLRTSELERMNTLMIGRELKMAELKKRLDQCKKELPVKNEGAAKSTRKKILKTVPA